ncbi:MAG: hypothetical protein JNK04_00375, partial [Myxococcales bacterium]|nr:hypothetical protein [Myxococcales bacterium]
MTRSLRKQKPRRAWWLFAFAAYSLIASWGWQLGLVEVFEHHDELAETCPDGDEKGPCECGDNCHCCLLCAHQAAPAVAPVPVEVPSVVLAVVELALLHDNAAPPSVDQAR